MSRGSIARRVANAEATRALIVAKARAVFALRGYNDAGLAEIVEAASVTTGAIYHHFTDKKRLFLAVAESVEREILSEVMAAAASVEPSDAWKQLLAGVDATLTVSAKPDVQRIVFIDAPTVIGPAKWREIEMRYAFGAMQQTLQNLIDTGLIRSNSAEILASILLGALIEAANAVAQAPDKELAMVEARQAIAQIFGSLRPRGVGTQQV